MVDLPEGVLDLQTVLADLREEAVALRRAHAEVKPDRLEEWANIIERAAEPWLLWISEGDAATRAGKSLDWIRARYEPLYREGHARTVNGKRQYRQAMIPQRAHVDVAAARGRQAAQDAREERERSRRKVS